MTSSVLFPSVSEADAETPTSHAEAAREHLLLAAESCFARYGIAKTTMHDIARASGVSRPTVYRYFADREALILAVVLRRSRLLVRHARAFIDQQDTFANKLVEGLLYMVDHGRHDEIVRLLVSPEHMDLATVVVGGSSAAAQVTAETWEPILAEAQERGEVPASLDRAEACAWLTYVQLILIGRMDISEQLGEDVRSAQRAMLRRFVLPAFAAGVVPT